MSDPENEAARFAREFAANTEKVFKAAQLIANTRDEEVKVGTTPKHLVMRRDKVELFRYEPLAQQTVSTPVLVAYGLIGRYTMADLQPDRSLVRSLLNKGLDLWLIDWGQPGRNERWLTIDDYVDDYIDAAVDRIRKETGHDRVTLLGICEGGVFTVCYAALHPEKVKNLVITISHRSTSMLMSTPMRRITASSTCGPAASIRPISINWSIPMACCRASS
jgi:polyhydroxyalkanoate synthase subunit PhaC